MNEAQINDTLQSICNTLSATHKTIIVKKRNGSKVQFDKTKVKDAIKPAFKRSHVRYTNDIYEEILTNIYKKVAEKILPFELSHIIVPDSCRTIKVETIQDIVEDTLMGSFPQVAKEYILYRKHKEQIRDWVDTKEAFITKYKEASNTANATIDDNSNVSNRNIGILNTEIHKEDNIQISRRMVVRKLRKLFPDFDAKQYERDLANHIIYKHDESSFAGAVAPYTYSSKEVVIVRYYDNTFTIPMDMLYDMCDEPEVCVDTTNEVYQKYPDNLFVYDYNNEWTQVTHLTKKKRHRDLVRVKTNFGEDLVVTDNHPLITNIENIEDTTQAIDATNKIQYKTNESISFKFSECNTIDLAEVIGGEVFDNYIIYNKGVMKRYLKLDRDFGYFVGFFVGDGNYQNNDNYINFTQKNITILHKLNKISFDSLGIIGSLYHKNDLYNCNGLTYRYRGLYEIFRNYFHIEDKAQNKTLPVNIFDTNEQFALGILEGILDSDGIVYGNQISYKLSSRAAILQISILLRYFGYSVGNTIQDAPFGNNASYNTNYSLWGVNFTRKNDATPLSNSIKYNKATIQKTASKYKKSGETKINSVVKISDQSSFLTQNKYIYDITTSTHTFSMNNLLVHNCVALTMYPFLDEGIKGIGGLSAKPKNLDSFCGMFVNMIFAISAQFAGACNANTQQIIWNDGTNSFSNTFEDFVGMFDLNKHFSNYQGNWDYADIKGQGYKVLEDDKFVDINRVFRRTYNEPIYRIKTNSGYSVDVSKDHKFKTLFRGRELDIPANELVVGDTVFMNKDVSIINNWDSLDYKKGWMVGIICGDGRIDKPNKCLSQKYDIGLSINYDQEYFGEIFNAYCDDFNMPHLNKIQGNKCSEYRKYNQQLYEFITKDIIGQTTYDKHIDISNKSLDYLTGFLDGIMCADGHFSDKDFVLSLTNESLIKNIDDILSKLNIPHNSPTIYINKKRPETKPLHTIRVKIKTTKYLKNVWKKRIIHNQRKVDHTREVYYYGKHAFKGAKGNTKTNCMRITDGGKYAKQLKTDVIDSIEIIEYNHGYVYEIETSSHYYNDGGFITHNCACPEALLYFDYFARKEWGDDYYLHVDDIVNPRSSHPRTIGEQIRQHFQQIVYSINQPAAARGLQSAFVNFSYYDKAFFESMFGDFMFPDFTKPQWESLNWLQKDFMQWFNEERLHCVLTFPVESFALVYKDGEFLDKENADFVADEYARGHSFFTYISDTVDSLSSCCRLRNALETKEFNFTNGNLSLQTGSKSVITLNLSRIIQDAILNTNQYEKGTLPQGIQWKEYKDVIQESLKDILSRVYKYHTAYNELLWDMKDAKLLPVYDAGFINLDKQYLTIGLNGLNQAAEYLGLTCNDNEEYKSFCQFIFGFVAQMNKGFEGKFNGHKVKANTEQVPAESLAVKNYNWDKEDGYWVPDDTNLYASYVFKPNDDTTDIYEKIRMHGREYIGEYLDGGSAAHINLSEHLTKEQYKNVIKYVAEQGCNYFTFNIPMSECCDCGHIVNAPIKKCPKCGSEHIKYWTRVIGYLTAVPSWSQGRQEEFQSRIFHNKDGYLKFDK